MTDQRRSRIIQLSPQDLPHGWCDASKDTKAIVSWSLLHLARVILLIFRASNGLQTDFKQASSACTCGISKPFDPLNCPAKQDLEPEHLF